jgi:hypothetical protein
MPMGAGKARKGLQGFAQQLTLPLLMSMGSSNSRSTRGACRSFPVILWREPMVCGWVGRLTGLLHGLFFIYFPGHARLSPSQTPPARSSQAKKNQKKSKKIPSTNFPHQQASNAPDVQRGDVSGGGAFVQVIADHFGGINPHTQTPPHGLATVRRRQRCRGRRLALRRHPRGCL